MARWYLICKHLLGCVTTGVLIATLVYDTMPLAYATLALGILTFAAWGYQWYID